MKPEAVILGNLGRKGYGVMRSLGRAGVSVVGTTDQGFDTAACSRYCRRYYSYSNLVSDEQLCKLLLQWRADFDQNPVLFAVYDHNAMFLAKYRESLSPHYAYHWLPLNALLSIINKNEMSLLCKQAGVLIPRTHVTRREEDLPTSARAFTFPCLVKPIRKLIPGFPTDRKNYLARSPKELMEFYRRHPGLQGTTIWQELLEGGDEHNVVCAMVVKESGEPAGIFSTRKLHQYPPYGVMCYGRSEWNDAVVSEALRLARFLGYRGVCSLEFKYQPKDGRYYFIEMNTRWPQYCGYFADAGVNLPYLAYLDLAGYSDKWTFPVRQRNAVYWVNAHDEGKRCWENRKEYRSGLIPWLQAVARADSYAFWNWRDPAPFFVACFQTLRAGMQKLSPRVNPTKRGRLIDSAERQKTSFCRSPGLEDRDLDEMG